MKIQIKMIKRYKSLIHRCLLLTGNIKDESGKDIEIRIDFNSATSMSKAYYSTSNQLEQKFIENTTDFKNGIIVLESTMTEEKTPKTEEKKEYKETLTYSNKQDLFNKMTEVLPNVEVEKTATIEELLKLAENNGYKFVKD